MKNKTILLMCSLVYFPSVAGTAHAGSIPLREMLLPPSLRLTIACTSEQTLRCLNESTGECGVDLATPQPNDHERMSVRTYSGLPAPLR